MTDFYKWYCVEELMAIANPISPEDYRAKLDRDLMNVLKPIETENGCVAWQVTKPFTPTKFDEPFRFKRESVYWFQPDSEPPKKWWEFWK